MKNRKEESRSERRDFLKMAGVGAVAGSVMAVTAAAKDAEAATPQDSGDGYRESEHVKQVYALSRF